MLYLLQLPILAAGRGGDVEQSDQQQQHCDVEYVRGGFEATGSDLEGREAREGKYVRRADRRQDGRAHSGMFIYSCQCVFVCESGCREIMR